LFPDDLLARLAVTVSLVRLENELEAAGFANPVLLSALLAEIPPTPEATGPAGLVEETHSNRAKGVPESSGHRRNFEVGQEYAIIWAASTFLCADSQTNRNSHWGKPSRTRNGIESNRAVGLNC